MTCIMSKRYMVLPPADQQGEQEEQTPARGFQLIPRELQTKVLEHTAAGFEVTFKTVEDMRHKPPYLSLSFLPVVVRCEFKLERRRASGLNMHARFTQAVDPDFKDTPRWHSLSDVEQAEIEAFRRKAEFESFQQLKVDENRDTDMLFCFLRGGPPRMLVECAPMWSRFSRSVLTDVRKKMDTVFYLPLTFM